MKLKKRLLTLIISFCSLALLAGCDQEELLTGQKNYSHTPESTRVVYPGTSWADYIELKDLEYSNGAITSIVTNLTDRDLSAYITIRWQCNGKSGKTGTFLKLEPKEIREMQCVDYSLDSPGDTYRVIRVESVAFGDWESEEDYLASAAEKRDLLRTLDYYQDKILSKIRR